jgi:hypothetical protein
MSKEIPTAKESYYHGSPEEGIEELELRPSRVLNNEKAVFGTADRDVALSFGRRWRDEDLEHGSVNGQHYMREMYPEAYEKIFDGPGHVYELEDSGFGTDPRLTRSERISRNPTKVTKAEKIDNVLEALRQSSYLMLRHGEEAPWEKEEREEKAAASVVVEKAAALAEQAEGRVLWHVAPRKAIDSIRAKGLLSSHELAKDPEALGLARAEHEIPDWRALMEKQMEWDSRKGPNVMFSKIPDSVQLPDTHPTKTNDTVLIKVLLDKLLKAQPDTRVHGLELAPFDEVFKDIPDEMYKAMPREEQDKLIDKRKRQLTPEELKNLIDTSPEDLWKHYKDPGKPMYAPDVPHAALITPSGRVDPEFLDFSEVQEKAGSVSPLPLLHKAKAFSDEGDYREKAKIIHAMMAGNPQDWAIDQDEPGNYVYGVTHVPTGFRFHLPKTQVTPGVPNKAPAPIADLAAGLYPHITQDPEMRRQDLEDKILEAASLEDDGKAKADALISSHWLEQADPSQAELAAKHRAGLDVPEERVRQRLLQLQQRLDETGSLWGQKSAAISSENEVDMDSPEPPITNPPQIGNKLVVGPQLTGPGAIAHALGRIDMQGLEDEHREIIRSKRVTKRPRAVAVLNTLEGLRRNNLTPADLMIKAVPVIPPIFRPFRVMGSTFVPGDANELYQDTMRYRDSFKETRAALGDLGAADARLSLYDSVKALYGHGDSPNPKLTKRGVAGFLQTLTGTSPKFSWVNSKMVAKPVDTVSRGTITVNPDLTIDEIGIPEYLAWKMYGPFIQRHMVRNMSISPAQAVKNLKEQNKEALYALERVMDSRTQHGRPVIYSRAPSWHKFNVLAAHPKLVKGNSIQINPFVTTGMNADFDGDQMNVHVPVGADAVDEAHKVLMPSKMVWSPRKFDTVVPQLKHEQLLGLANAMSRASTQTHYFDTEAEALKAIENRDISLKDEVVIGKRKPEVSNLGS